MNKIQTICASILAIFLQYIPSVFAYSKASRSDLLVGGDGGVGAGTDANFQWSFLTTAERYMSGLLAIIAVGVFIYLGFRLFTARGNEEDFKKAWTALVYACVGLAVVPLSYVVVRVVLGFVL